MILGWLPIIVGIAFLRMATRRPRLVSDQEMQESFEKLAAVINPGENVEQTSLPCTDREDDRKFERAGSRVVKAAFPEQMEHESD
jgi:hypothetical protein